MFGILRVIAGPDQGYAFTVLEGETLVVGRGPASQTYLRDPRVVPVHCRLQVQGDQALLSDSDSTAGTRVNGKKITQHVLQPEDIVQIGATQLSFAWSSADEYSTVNIPGGPGS
jgi:pSer/pThr/pTyr-binding forkhead associated (FHA) protein